VNYIENPVQEIKSRLGWGEIAAVKNNAVYYINADASNRPNHNIIKALKEMARVVYSDEY
jgi:iron complex transport system substrate-binding protein